jgi:hypothetical protein
MKFASTTALALSLAIGAVAVTGVSPALAKKKDDAQPTAGKQDFSTAFRQAVQPLQQALQGGDVNAAKAALPAAQQAASTPDDKFAVAQIQYSIAQKSNDQAGASAAVDAMLASGKAPADLQVQLLTAQAQYAFNAGKFDAADRAFTQLNQQKPNDPDILTSLAAVKAREGQQAAALPYLDQAIQAGKQAGKQPDEDLYQRALAIAYDGKNPAGVIKYGQWLVDAYPTNQNWRSALQTYRDTNKLDPQADLDVMRLAKASNSLAGERDYYEYANSALNKGYPGEAKAVIDSGMSSNMVDNKALATSKALAEIKAVAGPKVAADKASLPSLDKAARGAADGKRALQTADAYLGYGEYPQAVELYKVALQKGGVDAGVVNLHMGEALAQSGQKPAAAQALGQVTGPLQTVAQYWTIYANKGAVAAAPKAAAAQ